MVAAMDAVGVDLAGHGSSHFCTRFSGMTGRDGCDAKAVPQSLG